MHSRAIQNRNEEECDAELCIYGNWADGRIQMHDDWVGSSYRKLASLLKIQIVAEAFSA